MIDKAGSSSHTTNRAEPDATVAGPSSTPSFLARAVTRIDAGISSLEHKLNHKKDVKKHLFAQTTQVQGLLTRRNDAAAVTLLRNMNEIAKNEKLNLRSLWTEQNYFVPIMATAATFGARQSMQFLANHGLGFFWEVAVVGALIGTKNRDWAHQAFQACWKYNSGVVTNDQPLRAARQQAHREQLMDMLLATNDVDYMYYVMPRSGFQLAGTALARGNTALAQACMNRVFPPRRARENQEPPPPYEEQEGDADEVDDETVVPNPGNN